MNTVGAFLCLAASIAAGFGIYIALEQRFGIKELILGRLPVIRRKQWAVAAVMLGFIVLFGLFCLVMRISEAVYYIVIGLLIGFALCLTKE